MASIFVLLIIAGCAAFQYLKGSLVKAFATIIITICASIVAFGYYEAVAGLLVTRSDDSKYLALVPWAQPLAFILLFILAFAILQTIAAYMNRHKIDFGFLPELIGRVVCGIFLGLFLSGILLTALAMAPLPNKYPYQRFNERNPDAERPGKVLLSADGLSTGWFSMISNGSFSAIRNKRSFAALHPALLDQLFLNRHSVSDEIPIITSSQAIELPDKKEMPTWWSAPEDIRDQNGNPLRKTGYDLTIVRIGIKRSAIRLAGTFTLSQIRLICKEKGYENPLTGKAVNVYPIGYLKAQNQLQKKRLNEKIKIESSALEDKVKWIDFAFDVPNGYVPALAEFKLNSIAVIETSTSAEQSPPVIPFSQPSDKGQDAAEPAASAIPDTNRQPKNTASKRRGLSDFSRSIVGDQSNEDE